MSKGFDSAGILIVQLAQVFGSAGIRFCKYSNLQVFVFEGIISAGIRFCRDSILQVFGSAGV